MRASRLDLVSLKPAEIQCLRLVANHLTSKEIALLLGISRHTVDQRVRAALKATGAPSRRDAAKLIRQQAGVSQYGAEPLAEPESSASTAIARPVCDPSELALPWATASRPQNRMRAHERLLWILAIGLIAGLASLIYLAGLESLARLLAAR